jgi:hypothetical protein
MVPLRVAEVCPTEVAWPVVTTGELAAWADGKAAIEKTIAHASAIHSSDRGHRLLCCCVRADEDLMLVPIKAELSLTRRA